MSNLSNLKTQCFATLLMVLFTSKSCLCYEVDRSYAIGNHGYNSFADTRGILATSTQTNIKENQPEPIPGRLNGMRIGGRRYRKKTVKLNTPRFQPRIMNGIVKAMKQDKTLINKTDNNFIKSIFRVKDGMVRHFQKFNIFNTLWDFARILQSGHRKEYAENTMFEVPVIEKQEKLTNQRVQKEENHFSNENNEEEYIQKIHKESKHFSDIRREGKIVNEFNGTKKLKSDVEEVPNGRFLSIFEVVNFKNVECVSSTGLRGTCVHPLECSAASGLDMGSCANGFGVCCIFQYSCGDQTSANCSTFTNPGFPKPSMDQLSCTLTIHKANSGVKQLRLDIVQMELQPPTNGSCVNDQFVVSGHNVNSIIPILCGINNNQHVYVEVGDVSGPFYLSLLTASPAPRLLQVGVCQLSEGGAPPGCLQYYTDRQATLETFNYKRSGNIPGYRAPGYYNNLNYAICIARASGTCSVTYSTASENEQNEFQILNYDLDGVPLIPPGQAGAEIFNCPDDFIIINGVRLCGERLNDASITEDFTMNAPVTELSSGPIVFVFRTNGNVTGRGFKLFYTQNPCIAQKQH